MHFTVVQTNVLSQSVSAIEYFPLCFESFRLKAKVTAVTRVVSTCFSCKRRQFHVSALLLVNDGFNHKRSVGVKKSVLT